MYDKEEILVLLMIVLAVVIAAAISCFAKSKGVVWPYLI